MDWIILLVLVVALITYFVGTALYRKTYLQTLTEEDFRAGYRKAQLIDVREPDEFKNGHILGARNIPLTQMRQRLGEIRNDQPIYLYCESGMRSARAAQFLKKKKYSQLYHLKGGFKKWTGKVKKSK
ncbi:rhodanese-like domain-containing protein [Fictibacillus sp. Mic-4]|uniref:rhodanese-like domain-containing protein n=1 Tax=Fictibacillus sp. Mic-4 TaxID=3132826 RepID=UPI003CEDC1FC